MFVALILFLIGQFIALIMGYKPLPMELAGTIVTGLIGYMGKSLVDKFRKDNPPDSKNSKEKPPEGGFLLEGVKMTFKVIDLEGLRKFKELLDYANSIKFTDKNKFEELVTTFEKQCQFATDE